jgi:hypothetical protein
VPIDFKTVDRALSLSQVSARPGLGSGAAGNIFAALLAGFLLVEPAAAQRVRTVADEPSNASNPEIPYWANNRFDDVRFMSEFASHFVLSHDPKDLHSFAFFPPVPPPLESEIPILAPLESGPPADPELSAFVGDIFYPFLGVRLAYGEVSKALRAHILAYRGAKVALEVALHSRILELKDADEAARETQLAALAAQQAPRISELEATADKILSELRQIRVLGMPVEYTDLYAKPEWRVLAAGDTPSSPPEIHAQAEAVRGFAFYEPGLTAAQRHLFFEESIELYDRSRGMPSDIGPGFRLLYFSPEGTRIRIPATLPDSLERKIAEYTSAKNTLKAEARDALRRSTEFSPDSRMDAMAKVGADQVPKFAALDLKAEEIRRDLAALPNPPGPPTAPSLPADLTARIYAYRMHKVELLRKLRSMLASPTPALPANHQSQDLPNPVEGALAWMHDGSSRTEVQSTELRVSVGEFDRLQTELIEALNKEENGIREQLAVYARATNGPSDRKSINDLLRDFEDARQRQEIWDKYKDYQTAALMPGLSAGQRRLLFDAAVEELNLPLPSGDKF